MTNYTTKGSYPYPDPTDAITDYPATASTFAGYVDNLPNRNVIINGNFDIWQRGTSFTTPTNGSYTADRWRLSYDGTGGTRSVTMNANVGAPLTGGMQQWRTLNLQQAIAGTGQTSLALSQRIENARTFAAETVTASAYIWGTTSTITVKLVQNFGTGGSPSSPVTTTLGTFAVSGVRNRMKLTATIPTAVSKTFGTNNDDYLELVFEVGGTGSSSFYFWGVQLEQNSTATALERRPLQQELALCQRYYETSYTSGITPGTDGLQVNQTGGFVHFAANSAGGYVSYAVRKRAGSHSVSLWAPLNTPSANKARRSFDGTTQAATASFTTEIGFNTAITGGTNDQYQIGWAASAEL